MAASTTAWTLDGPRVLVNNKPFFANGVSYSSLPWGSCPAFEPYGDFTIKAWSSVWQRDVALMRTNAVNVLKTYNTLDRVQSPAGDIDHGPFLDACWNDGTNPVFVLMGYAPPKNQQHIFIEETWNNPQNVALRAKIAKDIAALAAAYAKHPAVMGFVMANETNAIDIIHKVDKTQRDKDGHPIIVVVGDNVAYFQYWNEVSTAIATAAPGKLALLANVDDSMNTVNAGNKYMTAANFFWGYNSYRGNWTNSNGFDNLFSTFATATKSNPKPLMLTEWGAPGSTHSDFPAAPSSGTIAEMSAAQMKDLCAYVSGHYGNMLANRSDSGPGVCCGGAYFEWSDEWWKADPIQCNAPNAAPTCYAGVWNPGPNMSFQPNYPGGYWDEEGFGLHAIAPVSPSTRVPVVPGGCLGPWNPQTNSPYPPDTLTARAQAKTLFAAFAANPSKTSA
ncbi:MAG: hypothetical protein HY244_18680 [Rhizobiales bacterium]|nr:hypothetical protein [Hyphomicrobiales bacterium]